MEKLMYSEISNLMYDLFVVNRYAAAIQQADGRYVTKYFPVTPFVIEEMLKQNGSMGCYQQGYKTDKIKWICFDFDCPDKDTPDMQALYNDFVCPFVDVLDELSINYLTEFSGRRGIHVWIIFNTIFSKKIGFAIVQELRKKCKNVFGREDIHVDLFPAVETSSGNVVGKQVKLPLSCHRSGGRSYLFRGNFEIVDDRFNEAFIGNQTRILSEYITNDIEFVEKQLGIDCTEDDSYTYKYKKYVVKSNVNAALIDIENILSQTKVFSDIFSRMKKGLARREDWTVLLGTLAYCDTNFELVQALFSTFPNYDFQKTITNIKRLSDKYYPATFGYLYQLYDLEPEETIDLNETGLSYLLRKLGCSDAVLETTSHLSERQSYQGLEFTLLKEQNYLLDNDEVPDAIISNELKNMKPYDLIQLDNALNKIKSGEWKDCEIPTEYVVYQRIESIEKTRKMVSLSARDRLITTQAIVTLQYKIKDFYHSYSYNISHCVKDQIFYAWYSSWMNYVNNVKAFLDVPFLHSYNVFTMDIKSFYDNVDFLTIYQALQKYWEKDIETKNILKFLIAYNENLMKAINSGNRKGVPQGPAYARVIAELYLDYIIQSVISQFDNNKFHYFRYVDDIVVYYNPDFEGQTLYNELANTLASFGLHLNTEKSRMMGAIGTLSEEEKCLITHKDKFSYDLQKDDNSILFEKEQNRRIKKYLQTNEYDISVISYIFGKNTLPKAADVYYKKYADHVFSERMGRGSYFKRFYEYVLDKESRVVAALDSGCFSKIPVNSLNFSNLINLIYLKLQNHTLAFPTFKLIKNKYLNQVLVSVYNKRDQAILEALLLCKEENDHE